MRAVVEGRSKGRWIGALVVLLVVTLGILGWRGREEVEGRGTGTVTGRGTGVASTTPGVAIPVSQSPDAAPTTEGHLRKLATTGNTVELQRLIQDTAGKDAREVASLVLWNSLLPWLSRGEAPPPVDSFRVTGQSHLFEGSRARILYHLEKGELEVAVSLARELDPARPEIFEGAVGLVVEVLARGSRDPDLERWLEGPPGARTSQGKVLGIAFLACSPPVPGSILEPTLDGLTGENILPNNFTRQFVPILWESRRRGPLRPIGDGLTGVPPRLSFAPNFVLEWLLRRLFRSTGNMVLPMVKFAARRIPVGEEIRDEIALYLDSFERNDWKTMSSDALRLIDSFPRQVVRAMIPVWCAHRAGDRRGFEAAAVRPAAMVRYQFRDFWALTEIARLRAELEASGPR